jgi:hypothetical protein
MSIIDQNLDDVPDRTNVPAGEQHLVVTKAEVARNKDNTRDQIVVSLAPYDGGDFWPLRQYFPLVDAGHEKYDTYRRMLKDFCEAFGVPIRKGGKIDTEDMVGKDAWVIIKTEEFEGKEKAVVDRYVRPASK